MKISKESLFFYRVSTLVLVALLSGAIFHNSVVCAVLAAGNYIAMAIEANAEDIVKAMKGRDNE